MKNLNTEQTFRANQIKGFVNLTLKNLPTKDKEGVNEIQAQYIIHAVLHNEKDEAVIAHCNAKFKEWYNYQ